jgi:hypothetical protein
MSVNFTVPTWQKRDGSKASAENDQSIFNQAAQAWNHDFFYKLAQCSGARNSFIESNF